METSTAAPILPRIVTSLSQDVGDTSSLNSSTSSPKTRLSMVFSRLTFNSLRKSSSATRCCSLKCHNNFARWLKNAASLEKSSEESQHITGVNRSAISDLVQHLKRESGKYDVKCAVSYLMQLMKQLNKLDTSSISEEEESESHAAKRVTPTRSRLMSFQSSPVAASDFPAGEGSSNAESKTQMESSLREKITLWLISLRESNLLSVFMSTCDGDAKKSPGMGKITQRINKLGGSVWNNVFGSPLTSENGSSANNSAVSGWYINRDAHQIELILDGITWTLLPFLSSQNKYFWLSLPEHAQLSCLELLALGIQTEIRKCQGKEKSARNQFVHLFSGSSGDGKSSIETMCDLFKNFILNINCLSLSRSVLLSLCFTLSNLICSYMSHSKGSCIPGVIDGFLCCLTSVIKFSLRLLKVNSAEEVLTSPASNANWKKQSSGKFWGTIFDTLLCVLDNIHSMSQMDPNPFIPKGGKSAGQDLQFFSSLVSCKLYSQDRVRWINDCAMISLTILENNRNFNKVLRDEGVSTPVVFSSLYSPNSPAIETSEELILQGNQGKRLAFHIPLLVGKALDSVEWMFWFVNGKREECFQSTEAFSLNFPRLFARINEQGFYHPVWSGGRMKKEDLRMLTGSFGSVLFKLMYEEFLYLRVKNNGSSNAGNFIFGSLFESNGISSGASFPPSGESSGDNHMLLSGGAATSLVNSMADLLRLKKGERNAYSICLINLMALSSSSILAYLNPLVYQASTSPSASPCADPNMTMENDLSDETFQRFLLQKVLWPCYLVIQDSYLLSIGVGVQGASFVSPSADEEDDLDLSSSDSELAIDNDDDLYDPSEDSAERDSPSSSNTCGPSYSSPVSINLPKRFNIQLIEMTQKVSFIMSCLLSTGLLTKRQIARHFQLGMNLSADSPSSVPVWFQALFSPLFRNMPDFLKISKHPRLFRNRFMNMPSSFHKKCIHLRYSSEYHSSEILLLNFLFTLVLEEESEEDEVAASSNFGISRNVKCLIQLMAVDATMFLVRDLLIRKSVNLKKRLPSPAGKVTFAVYALSRSISLLCSSYVEDERDVLILERILEIVRPCLGDLSDRFQAILLHPLKQKSDSKDDIFIRTPFFMSAYLTALFHVMLNKNGDSLEATSPKSSSLKRKDGIIQHLEADLKVCLGNIQASLSIDFPASFKKNLMTNIANGTAGAATNCSCSQRGRIWRVDFLSQLVSGRLYFPMFDSLNREVERACEIYLGGVPNDFQEAFLTILRQVWTHVYRSLSSGETSIPMAEEKGFAQLTSSLNSLALIGRRNTTLSIITSPITPSTELDGYNVSPPPSSSSSSYTLSICEEKSEA